MELEYKRGYHDGLDEGRTIGVGAVIVMGFIAALMTRGWTILAVIVLTILMMKYVSTARMKPLP